MLADFYPLPWGHLGKGPTAPTFCALSETGRLIAIKVTVILFGGPGFFPPAMCEGGNLFPMVLAYGAALLMYYPARHKVGVL